jgi:hypothetical protein
MGCVRVGVVVAHVRSAAWRCRRLEPPVTIAVALKSTIEATLCSLRVLRLVYPERYAITGLDEEIARVVDEVNAVFGARGRS